MALSCIVMPLVSFMAILFTALDPRRGSRSGRFRAHDNGHAALVHENGQIVIEIDEFETAMLSCA